MECVLRTTATAAATTMDGSKCSKNRRIYSLQCTSRSASNELNYDSKDEFNENPHSLAFWTSSLVIHHNKTCCEYYNFHCSQQYFSIDKLIVKCLEQANAILHQQHETLIDNVE